MTTIKTDHKPLTRIANLKESNRKLQKWKIQLEEYNYNIEYIKDKGCPDHLSRAIINANHLELSTSMQATYHNAKCSG